MMQCYSQRLDEALSFVADAFRNKQRKGTDIPYLAHLMQVFVTVAENGGDEDQLVAALLHDYLEDVQGASVDLLVSRFGERVARLVQDMSDSVGRPRPPWAERKQNYISHLGEAPVDLKLICAADKLHNVRSTRRDLEAEGPTVWDRFNAGRDGSLWYYREVLHALAQGWSHPLLGELEAEVKAIYAIEGEPWESRPRPD